VNLWRNSRTTDSPGAAKSAELLHRLKPRPAACALPRISLCLALLLTGCERAPSFDIVGSFFPAWLVCLALALVLTAVARWLLSRLRIVIAVPILTYPSLAALLTFALWLAFFR
jgi:YtcA family